MCQRNSGTEKQMSKSMQNGGVETVSPSPWRTGGSLERMKKDLNDHQEGRSIGNRCTCNTKYLSGIVSRVRAVKANELRDKKHDICTGD